MTKVLQCPWFASNGFSKWCMNGHFPCDCETCNCEDKKYVEIYTTTSTAYINEYKVMKANKAPEKLYYAPYGDIREDYPITDNDIEYVRKDSFIEKALKFIKTNVDRIVNNQHGVCMGCMDGEFRKYMKGE